MVSKKVSAIIFLHTTRSSRKNCLINVLTKCIYFKGNKQIYLQTCVIIIIMVAKLKMTQSDGASKLQSDDSDPDETVFSSKVTLSVRYQKETQRDNAIGYAFCCILQRKTSSSCIMLIHRSLNIYSIITHVCKHKSKQCKCNSQHPACTVWPKESSKDK